MKPVYLAIGLAASAAAFVGISMLISNVSSACVSSTNVIASLLFLFGSVAAAYGWVNGLGLKIKPNIKTISV